MNLTKILLASAILLSSQLAFANHHGDHESCEGMKNSDFSLKNLDKNNDGAISLEEYKPFALGDAEKSFKHVDANNDGKLDAQEQKDVEAVLKAAHSAKPKTPAVSM